MDAKLEGRRHADGPLAIEPPAGLPAQFVWPVRVYYEDTDAGGVVYHANYLKYLERARTEWLRYLGFEQDDLRRRLGTMFVVTSLKLDYHKPACFNAELLVSVSIAQMRRARVTFAQAIHSAAAGRARICSAQVTAACVNCATFKPQPWPQEIAAELRLP